MPQPLRICFVIENLMHAGTERWILRLVERLDRRRIEPHLCILDGRAGSSRALEPAGCGVLRLELPYLKSARTLSAAAAFHRYLRQNRIDIVQVHHADPTYFGVPLARLAGVRRVLQTKYDIGYWLRGHDLWMHRLLRRWIDATLANCQSCRQASIEQEWSPAEQVHVVDNGISVSALAAIPDLAAKDFAGAVKIGMIANLRPVKDHATLLKAMPLVLRSRPQTTLHLAGEGELRHSLSRLAMRLGIGDHVKFHGYVDDTARFLADMTIGVLCSKSEGLPHTLLEYMAAGRAVVATRVGGNSEVVIDGHTGCLVEPSKPDELSEALLRTLSQPERSMGQARRGRAYVVERFELETMTRRFESFYEQIWRDERIGADG